MHLKLKNAPLLGVVPFAMLLVILGLAEGCTRGCSNAKNAPLPMATPPTEAPPLKAGAMLFGFDYQSVSEVLIVKADPETGERWAAHLTRPKNSDLWELQSAGGAPPPLDRRADGFFILHLLDTMRTLHVEKAAMEGPHESLGLAPPRFALQWRAEGKEFEVRIGSPIKGTDTAYGWVPGQQAFVAAGATLTMLDYMKSFSSLRLKTWTGLAADDVDEVEIPSSSKPAFYAQREGADWNDRAHKPIHASRGFSAWLEKLTHQRIKEFVDDAPRAAALRAKIHASPIRKATLKDRHGQAVELELGKQGTQWFALSSARPDGVFEVFPESSQALEPPGRK
jgi:hypothetical protein